MARPRKHNPPLPDSKRVADYRQRLKQEGYKNISFVVSPQEYELIERKRAKYQLTTKELVMYYLTGQHFREGRGYYQIMGPEEFDEHLNLRSPADQKKYIEKAKKRGDTFYFPNQSNYVIVSLTLNRKLFPSWFPYEEALIKGFQTHREAMQYYFLRQDKLPKSKQLVLMKKAGEMELGWLPEEQSFYQGVCKLNDIYPDMPVYDYLDDSINYEAEFKQMADEFSDK